MKTRRLFALCMVLLMLFALAGCESKAVMENAPGAAMDSYKPVETMAAATSKPELSLGNTPAQNVSPVNQKLIRTVRLEAETEDMVPFWKPLPPVWQSWKATLKNGIFITAAATAEAITAMPI